MNWKVVKHKDLSMAEELQIAYLKEQHWQYGLESQILWMRDNIQEDDAHLIGERSDDKKTIIQAYLTLINLIVKIDGQCLDYIGVGCVCVDKAYQQTGIGRHLMKEAELYIKEQNKCGILLCKNTLVPFYKKCGWHQLEYQSATVAGNQYEHNIMLLDKACTCSNITIDRNF